MVLDKQPVGIVAKLKVTPGDHIVDFSDLQILQSWSGVFLDVRLQVVELVDIAHGRVVVNDDRNRSSRRPLIDGIVIYYL